MYRRKATITVAALDAGAEETYTITEAAIHPRAHVADSRRNIPDLVVINPPADAETGWGITKAWVDSEGVIKFTASNFGAGSLTGGSLTVSYCVLR
jgi:hypothetical protein